MRRRNSFARSCALFSLSLSCLSVAAMSLAWSADAASKPAVTPVSANGPKTIGLVLTGWRYALYETDYGKEECPDGLQPGERKQYQSMPDFEEHKTKVGGNFQTRGPNGETADNSPMVVQDAIPFREYKATKGFGLNLDGTDDGHATSRTCKHEKFTDPTGAKIDNQMQRVIGCVLGWRTGGQMAEYQADEFITRPSNRILLEISGVDDELNDPSVDVTIYKGIDRLVKAANDKFVPYTPQRIDDRWAKYTMKTHGKIVDGVLITDPIPNARIPASQEANVDDRMMTDLTIRLKLTGDYGEGFVSGYEQWKTWYTTHAKKVVADVGLYSSAALYRALTRYADGALDSTSGQCTGISEAFKVTAVRATIIHRPNKERVAQAQPVTRLASAQE